VEAGESLAAIVARQEAERVAGKNIFWWGVLSYQNRSCEKTKLSGRDKPQRLTPSSATHFLTTDFDRHVSITITKND
jgi:hypothetical protein